MFHGWKVVIYSFLVAMFGWGLGFYGVGVFLATLRDRHGWSTAEISSAITAYYILGATLILFVGNGFERFGPRRMVLAGVSAMGAGAVGLSMVSASWQLFLVFPVMAIGWACMSGAALNLLVAPWFERKRGLAVSMAFNGASFGGVLLAPALLFLIAQLGFVPGVLLVTLAMAAVLMPMGFAVLHRGPEVLGLGADGDPPARAHSTETPTEAPEVRRPRRREFLHGWHFWSISTPFALALLAQVGFLTHQVAFLRPILGASGVAWAVSLTAFAAVAGRLIVGAFVDRVNRRAVASGNFLMQAGALALMLYAPGPVALYVACAIFGLGVGNTTSLPSLIVQVEYSKTAFGQIVSTVVAVNQYTFSFGPILLGWLRDWQGTYGAALGACMGLLIVASALVLSRRSGMDKRLGAV